MKQEDFDEYIRQVEPSAQESAAAWQTAIGLQQVDGLKPSQYLLDVARRNIEGDITIDEVRQLLDTYYSSKTKRTPEDDDAAECDKASANIKKILSTRTFAFNTNGFVATHRRIFEGVFKHAGELRQFDITKKEWVLRGDTVNYLNWEDLRRAIDYDIKQEREFSYKGLTEEEKVRHICQFVSGLWQIHPFREGNTRTTAVFTIQYLRSLGYEATNDMFKEHSWYFRNALVRANYKNARLGIDYDFSFLERFFRNLLLNENNELRNRYMLINAPEGWDPTDDKSSTTDDKPTITDDKPPIILSYLKEKGCCKTSELSALLGLKPTQTKAYIYQLLKEGKIVAHGANKNRTYTLA
jgi:fido (protein-threonine AMPylation protein)